MINGGQRFEGESEKMECIYFNGINNNEVRMQDYAHKKVARFKYLGSAPSENGEIEEKVHTKLMIEFVETV